MSNGKGSDWLVGVAKWGYTPKFSQELDREIKQQKTKSEYQEVSREFAGKDIDAIDKELFRQSLVALDTLNNTNNELRKVSVQEELSDPLGKAGKLNAKVEEYQAKYDEIERKREVVRLMKDVQFWDRQDDPEKRVFYDKMQQHIASIDKASAESAEIGGVDVKLTFENAKLLANEDKWEKAEEWLDQAIHKAELVNQRKPFLTAKLAHEPKIKATCKIKKVNEATRKKYGEEVDAEWKEIQKVADGGAYGEAAGQVLELVRKIETVIDPALQRAREENANQLRELKVQLERAKGNPTLLREKAKEIFRNTGEAEDLGIDTGENARKKFTEDEGSVWTVQNCEETFAAYDWFALKKCRKAGTIKLAGEDRGFSDDDMWKLVQYRGKVVNDEIDKLRKAYPTLIAFASGSEDIESDIDIAFATPRSGDDVKAAKEFNKVITGRFGKPAGRVFDVNIYPRDYRALSRDTFKPNYSVDENKDEGIDEPDEGSASMKLSMIDQDVATLLKQRRFLDETAFNEMLQNLMDQAPDDTTKKRIEKQYEEGEDIYLLTSLEKVDKIRQKVNLDTPLTDPRAEKHRVELVKHIEDLEKVQGQGGKENLAQAQRLIPQILDMFEEVYPDESMDVTDELYLEKMGALREDQETIRMLKEEGDPYKHHPDKTCDEAHDGKEHAEWLKEKINALEVMVKKNMFTNIIFANEAIVSQGALNHVVGALQAKPEDRQKELDKLTASDLMQSVNEQVADLFKEMKHYDGVVEEAEEDETGETEKESAKRRATGEGYVHASKYLFRLLDAAILLNMKYPEEESVQAPYEAVKNTVGLDLVALKKQVNDVLLKLRKSAVIPPEVKGEVGALEMQEIFPQVTDIPSFRKMIEAFAIELNKRIRSLEEFKTSQERVTKEDEEAEKAYFATAGT